MSKVIELINNGSGKKLKNGLLDDGRNINDGMIVLRSGTGSISLDEDSNDNILNKRITWNDGGGNFNIRSGNYFSNIVNDLAYTKTGDGASATTYGSDNTNGTIENWVAERGTKDEEVVKTAITTLSTGLFSVNFWSLKTHLNWH